jgi:hypothetical protein
MVLEIINSALVFFSNNIQIYGDRAISRKVGTSNASYITGRIWSLNAHRVQVQQPFKFS